jgi:membrane-bound serine protease (ClpP class)
VIDFIAENVGDLLRQADGMTVVVNGIDRVLATAGLLTERLEPDWRNEFLGVITSPTIAYLLLLIGIYGLVLEGYNPGALVPGVVGAICLLMALYAFQMLPVNYAGLALIVLGIILMIAEVMAPSFGVLGIGGIAAMVIGSIILIDTDVPGFAVSRGLIGSIAMVGSLGLMAIVWFALRAQRQPVEADGYLQAPFLARSEHAAGGRGTGRRRPGGFCRADLVGWCLPDGTRSRGGTAAPDHGDPAPAVELPRPVCLGRTALCLRQ